MNIGEEDEPIEVPIPLHPGHRPATTAPAAPGPEPAPERAVPEQVPA
jgi:hypothetical protein